MLLSKNNNETSGDHFLVINILGARSGVRVYEALGIVLVAGTYAA